MFVDASAIIAIIAGEDDAASLAARLARAKSSYVSPIVIYEAVAGLARKRACPIAEADELVRQFVAETGAQSIDITDKIGREAVKAFDRFGRARHKADLNMGDCFAYACARTHRLELLIKGNDFTETDIPVA